MNYTAAAQQLRSMREEREKMRGDWLCDTMDRLMGVDVAEVRIPPGHYRIRRPLKMKPDRKHHGEGAVVEAIAPATHCMEFTLTRGRSHAIDCGNISMIGRMDDPSFMACALVHTIDQ